MRGRRVRSWTTTALLLAAAFLAPTVAGADSTPGTGPWLGLGLGGGHFSDVGGVAGHVDAGWGFGETFLSARLAGVADTIVCIFCQSKGDRVDTALLLGRQWREGSGLRSIAIGAGHVRGQHFGGSSVGLALEARLMTRLGRGFGFGLYGFANVNSKSSFFGVTLAVRFGGI